MSDTVTIPADVWKRTLERNDALKAENENMRMAGDVLVFSISQRRGFSTKFKTQIAAWLAAKGVQS